MAQEFKLPDLGEGLTEGEIARWLVTEGQDVAEDAPLVEIQTDKATVEIPSPYSGTVLRILVAEGEIAPVGAPLVLIGEAGEVVEGPDGDAQPGESEAPSYNLLQGPSVRLVRCDDWERGPAATLRCGLSALAGEVEAAVVVLADGPDLAPKAVERVLEVSDGESGIVAASYSGHRGHPLVLRRELWEDVPDEGLHERSVRLVPCDDLGAPGDVDEPDDLPARFRG